MIVDLRPYVHVLSIKDDLCLLADIWKTCLWDWWCGCLCLSVGVLVGLAVGRSVGRLSVLFSFICSFVCWLARSICSIVGSLFVNAE